MAEKASSSSSAPAPASLASWVDASHPLYFTIAEKKELMSWNEASLDSFIDEFKKNWQVLYDGGYTRDIPDYEKLRIEEDRENTEHDFNRKRLMTRLSPYGADRFYRDMRIYLESGVILLIQIFTEGNIPTNTYAFKGELIVSRSAFRKGKQVYETEDPPYSEWINWREVFYPTWLKYFVDTSLHTPPRYVYALTKRIENLLLTDKSIYKFRDLSKLKGLTIDLGRQVDSFVSLIRENNQKLRYLLSTDIKKRSYRKKGDRMVFKDIVDLSVDDIRFKIDSLANTLPEK